MYTYTKLYTYIRIHIVTFIICMSCCMQIFFVSVACCIRTKLYIYGHRGRVWPSSTRCLRTHKTSRCLRTLSIVVKTSSLTVNMSSAALYVDSVSRSCKVNPPRPGLVNSADGSPAFAICIGDRAVLPQDVTDILNDGFSLLAEHGFTTDGGGLTIPDPRPLKHREGLSRSLGDIAFHLDSQKHRLCGCRLRDAYIVVNHDLPKFLVEPLKLRVSKCVLRHFMAD